MDSSFLTDLNTSSSESSVSATISLRADFSPIADIDEKTDLAHAISCMRAIERAAKYQPELFVPRRVLDWVDFMGIRVSTPPNEEHDPRQYIDEA